jgi:hypothetical protein
VLPNEESRTWLAFVDSFFKFRDLRRYLHTYWHILASPTRNTLALAEEGNSAAAFQFLQTSLFIYTVAVISKLITGGLIVSQVVIPLILLISFANFGAIFYWFARRKSPRPRSGREFLILCSYSVGLAIPFAALVEILQPHATSFLVAHTSSFWLPLLVFTVVLLLLMAPLYLYVLRVWGRFWELRKRTVFLYLLIAGLVQMVIAVPAGFAWVSLRPPPALKQVQEQALAAVRRSNAQLAVGDRLNSWNEQLSQASELAAEGNYSDFNAKIESIGKDDGASIRQQFASVTKDLHDGPYILELLSETGDAAVALADVVKSNPLPYDGPPDVVLSEMTTLRDAITGFREALDRLNREMSIPQVTISP